MFGHDHENDDNNIADEIQDRVRHNEVLNDLECMMLGWKEVASDSGCLFGSSTQIPCPVFIYSCYRKPQSFLQQRSQQRV